MKGFRRVLSREFKRLFTSRDLLLICIAAPFVYSLMLTSVYVNQRVEKVNAGVVDNDLSKLSRSITRKLDASQNVRVKYRYQDAASARKALTAGEIDAFMYFPAGFAQDIKRGGNAWEIMTVNASNVLVANPVMQAVSDISLQASSEIFIRNLMKKGLTKEKAAAVNNPISVRVSVLFNKNLDYSLFMIPGLIFVIIQQIILVGLGYAMASEFEAGSIKELYNLSGRSTVAMILGKAVPYGLINLFMALLFIFFLLPLFGISTVHKAFVIAPFAALFVFTMTSLGMMFSSCFKSTAMALIVLMFYSMPTFLISGYSWPFFSMPAGMRVMSLIFPSTFFFDTLRLILLADIPFSNIFENFAVLFALSLIYFAAACLIFARMLKRSKA